MKPSKNERGVTIIEYALLLAVVVIGLILAFKGADLPAAITTLLNRIKTCLTGTCV